MGKLYEINVAAENDDGLSINATEFLTTPIGIPESEPTNIRYEINGEQVFFEILCEFIQIFR